MLLVKDKALERLAAALYQIRDEKKHGYRCLHLSLAPTRCLPDQLSAFCRAVAAELQDPEGEILLADEAGIFVLAKGITQKNAQMVGSHAGPGVAVRFFDLQTQWIDLIEMAEALIDNQKKNDAEQRLKMESEQARRRREEILSLPIDTELVRTISSRRLARAALEILVVEDDPFSRKLINNSLRGDFTITGAEDGQAAIMLYAVKAPDIVFLDIEMPDITGHDVLSKLMLIDPGAYIVMLSGNGNRENIMRAMSSGAKGFVGKPFTREKLISYIQRCSTFKSKSKEA